MTKSTLRQRTQNNHKNADVKNNSSEKSKPKEQNNESTTGNFTRCLWGMWSVLKWILIAVVIPPLLNYTSLQSEHVALVPTTALHYDVGQGQKLMLHCTGKGAPTLILESPAGISSDIWGDVRKQLEKMTRVCAYDRAGVGFSDRPAPSRKYLNTEEEQTTPDKSTMSQEFTVERMSDDLKRLVSESSSQPLPFILVGLELGALTSRFYSHMYDSQISQVILIDPLSSELFTSQRWLHHWKTDILYPLQATQLTGALGLNRLALITGLSELPPYWSTLSGENITARQLHLSCHPKHLKSAVDELAGVLDSLHQIKTLSSVKPFPKSLNYTVLYRNKYDKNMSEDLNDIWQNAKSNLAASLQIPAEQITVVETPSESIHGSLRGATLSKLTSLVRQAVRDFRKGKVLTS